MKKKFRLPVHLYLLYGVLFTLMLVGVTVAKYTVSSSDGDRARVIRMGKLEIEEEPSADEELIVTPGVDLSKRAAVSFEGSEAACYLFASVDAVGWTLQTDSTHSFQALNGALTWSVPSGDTGWTYLKRDGNEYVYYTVLEANTPVEEKEIVEDRTITVSEELTRSSLQGVSNLKLDFHAAVVQYGGFADADAAWISLQKQ